MLKHGILGLLNYGSMSGYEIMSVFRDSLSHFWTATTSQIYRELHNLEESGWAVQDHIEQHGRPDKNVFHITADGKEELLRWLSDDSSSSPPRSPLLMKTFFLGERSIEENIEYFRKIGISSDLFPNGQEETNKSVEVYRESIDDPLKAIYWKFTVDFGMMYQKLLADWSEKCISKLEAAANEYSSDKRESKG